jgi:hypothetical protein
VKVKGSKSGRTSDLVETREVYFAQFNSSTYLGMRRMATGAVWMKHKQVNEDA